MAIPPSTPSSTPKQVSTTPTKVSTTSRAKPHPSAPSPSTTTPSGSTAKPHPSSPRGTAAGQGTGQLAPGRRMPGTTSPVIHSGPPSSRHAEDGHATLQPTHAWFPSSYQPFDFRRAFDGSAAGSRGGGSRASAPASTHSSELADVFDDPIGPGLTPLGPAFRGDQIHAAERRESVTHAVALNGVVQGALADSDARRGTSLLGGPAGSFSFGAEPSWDPLRP